MKVTKIKERIFKKFSEVFSNREVRQNFNKNKIFQKKTNSLNSKGDILICNFCGLKFDWKRITQI